MADEFVEYKGKAYCCATCAFEVSLKLGSMCGSRSSVEAGMRFVRSQRPTPTEPLLLYHSFTVRYNGCRVS